MDELCNLCQEKENILLKLKYVTIILNKYPYLPGHIMIISNKHVSRLEDLTEEEGNELFNVISISQYVLLKLIDYTSCNIGCNIGNNAGASIPEHLHWHIVPRKENDTNFMNSICDKNRTIYRDNDRKLSIMLKDKFRNAFMVEYIRKNNSISNCMWPT